MRKYESQFYLSAEPELRHDRFKIVAIRAQSMQPYDCTERLLSAGDFHCFRYIQVLAPRCVTQRILTAGKA